VKLFFDEDIGWKLAQGFQQHFPDVDVDFVAPGRTIQPGDEDIKWIRYAGENNLLVISRNRRQLGVMTERQAMIDARIGIVYVPRKLAHEELFGLLLRKKRWLEKKYRGQNRPFEARVSPSGATVVHALH
jgi:PIN like domain